MDRDSASTPTVNFPSRCKHLGICTKISSFAGVAPASPSRSRRELLANCRCLSSSSDVDWEAVDDGTLAELEAEQAKYAAELEELRLAERHAAGVSSGGVRNISGSDQTAGLSAENARLRAELEAKVSVSASATRRDADDVKVKLAKLSAENAKLTAALATGVGLSGITGMRSSASVLAASRTRMAAMVGVAHVDICAFASTVAER